jgi:hypothetical protein
MKNQIIEKEKLSDKVYKHKDLFSILAVLIAGIIWIHTEIRESNHRIDQLGSSTDRLYEMFIDLLKEKK